jgi:hypothetical protein
MCQLAGQTETGIEANFSFLKKDSVINAAYSHAAGMLRVVSAVAVS